MHMQAADTSVASLLLSALLKHVPANSLHPCLSDREAMYLRQSSDAAEMIISNASFYCVCTGPLSGIAQKTIWL